MFHSPRLGYKSRFLSTRLVHLLTSYPFRWYVSSSGTLVPTFPLTLEWSVSLSELGHLSAQRTRDPGHLPVPVPVPTHSSSRVYSPDRSGRLPCLNQDSWSSVSSRNLPVLVPVPSRNVSDDGHRVNPPPSPPRDPLMSQLIQDLAVSLSLDRSRGPSSISEWSCMNNCVHFTPEISFPSSLPFNFKVGTHWGSRKKGQIKL